MDTQLIRQGLVAFAGGYAGIIMSFTLGYTSPGLPSMDKDPGFSLTPEQGSWIGAVVPGAALVGSLLAGSLLEQFGRKNLMVFSTLAFLISWLGIACAMDVSFVIAFRVVSGAALGIQTVAGSVYQSEMIHVQMRPKLAFLPVLMSTSGLLILSVAGIYLQWRDLAWLGSALCVPMLLLSLYLPDSPYYLSKKGFREDSLRCLTWLRGSSVTARQELKEYDVSSSNTSHVTLSSTFQQPFRWGVSMSILLHIFQQTTGINAIIFYSVSIFEASGSSIDPARCSVIMTATNIIATLSVTRALGYGKRRAIMTDSSKYVVLSLSVMCAYLYVQPSVPGQLTGITGIVPLIAMVVYIAAFAAGWGPIPWMFLGEGLCSGVRGTGASLAIAANWTFAFIVTKTFARCEQHAGLSGVFFGYAVVTSVAQLILNKYMPETLGKSASQIDTFYKDSYSKKSK